MRGLLFTITKTRRASISLADDTVIPSVWLAAAIIAAISLTACDRSSSPSEKTAVPGVPGAVKTVALERAKRRAFDGAPPVIPHQNFNITCVSCHNLRGTEVPPFGFAPPMPHEKTPGMSTASRCRQCHVFRQTEAVFVANTFKGLPQNLRHGQRLNPLAPPVIPHRVFMRENCAACHTGPAAREEVRCDHPQRLRCRQCHLERKVSGRFSR